MPMPPSPPLIGPALVMVLLLPALMPMSCTQPHDVPNCMLPRLATILLSATTMPKALPTAALPTVIVPVAALVMVLPLPAKIAVLSSPALTAPLLVSVLLSLRKIVVAGGAAPLLTVAPVNTLTVSWPTAPALKPLFSVPLQVTVSPLLGTAG